MLLLYWAYCHLQAVHVIDLDVVTYHPIFVGLTHWTKWSPFCRHFQIHFLDRRCVYICEYCLKFVMKGCIYHLASIGSGNGFVSSGQKPLLELFRWPRSILPYGITRPQWFFFFYHSELTCLSKDQAVLWCHCCCWWLWIYLSPANRVCVRGGLKKWACLFICPSEGPASCCLSVRLCGFCTFLDKSLMGLISNFSEYMHYGLSAVRLVQLSLYWLGVLQGQGDPSAPSITDPLICGFCLVTTPNCWTVSCDLDVCSSIYNELSPRGASANKQTMHEWKS